MKLSVIYFTALWASERNLKEHAHKDYLSFQKKGVGETNILQQIL